MFLEVQLFQKRRKMGKTIYNGETQISKAATKFNYTYQEASVGILQSTSAQ